MQTAAPKYQTNTLPPASQWPVLHIRKDRDGRAVATGPAHAVFGNSQCASPSVEVPTDPYAEWNWDGTQLRVRTDRYGFFPIFYYIDSDGIRVSPSLVALLESGASNILDDSALAVLLRAGFFVGDDTPFRNIRLVPPHGVLTWEAGRVEVHGSLVPGKRHSYTRESALDGYIEVFREAVRRRPAQEFSVMPLSGGRDSRHIFLELCSQGRAPDLAVTIGPPPSYETDEVAAAHAIASAAGVPHSVFSPPDPQWPAECKTRVDTHFATTDHWWLQSLMGYLSTVQKQTSNVTVYEGVAGDVLSTFILKTPDRQQQYADGQFDVLAESLLGDEGYLPKMLKPEFYHRVNRERARARLVEELERHANQSHPLASFFVYNRTRRVTGIPPSSLLSPFATVWCPYLDADVFDFLMSLAPELLMGETIQEFHDLAIQRAYPKFAQIPFSSKYGFRKRIAPIYQTGLLRDMSRQLLQEKPHLIQPTFFYPRLARAAIDLNYWSEIFKISSLSNYLFELSRYVPE